MKNLTWARCITILGVMLISCSVFTPRPTATPVPSQTPSPAPTRTPAPTATDEPAPTATLPPAPTEKPTQAPLAPTQTVDVAAMLQPQGTPAADWKGIAIMPGALAGQDDGSSYTFTIQATPAEIQSFYEENLGPLGWEVFASGAGDTGAAMLIFMKGDAMITFAVLPQADGISVVLMAQ